MEINNFNEIRPLLNCESTDDFYFIQLLQRKKEHPELGSNSRVVKTYYIRDLEHFNSLEKEIIALCKLYDARAYIHLQKRSFYKCTMQMLKGITEYILQPDFEHSYRVWDSVCGQHGNGQKFWVVDVDNPDLEKYDVDLLDLIKFIDEDCEPGNAYIMTLPTKNGHHLITKPFNLKKFSDKFPEIQVHKNNPTILYIPDAEDVKSFQL